MANMDESDPSPLEIIKKYDPFAPNLEFKI